MRVPTGSNIMLEVMQAIICDPRSLLFINEQNIQLSVVFEVSDIAYVVHILFPCQTFDKYVIDNNSERIHGTSYRTDKVRQQVTVHSDRRLIIASDSVDTNFLQT